MSEALEDAIYTIREKYQLPVVEGSWRKESEGVWRGPSYHFGPQGLDDRGRLKRRRKQRVFMLAENHKEICLGTLGSLVVRTE